MTKASIRRHRERPRRLHPPVVQCVYIRVSAVVPASNVSWAVAQGSVSGHVTACDSRILYAAVSAPDPTVTVVLAIGGVR